MTRGVGLAFLAIGTWVACDAEQSGADAAGADAAPCAPLLTGITVVGAAEPGARVRLTAQLAAVAPPGVAEVIAWRVGAGAGELSATVGPSIDWELSSELARHVAELVRVTATASVPGCAVEETVLELTVDHPSGRRVIVLLDDRVPGVEQVADAYAALRGVPDENRCRLSPSDPTSLPGDEYPVLLDDVLACVARARAEVHYLVPLYGVPYKVRGRIGDLGNPTVKVETSLDALLAFGARSVELARPIDNLLYRFGSSITGTYVPWLPIGEYRAANPEPIFIVSRLDGATAADTLALVERTAAADALAVAGALAGTVYVDGNRGLPHPTIDPFGSYEGGEWNIIGVDRLFTDLGWYEVVADYQPEEFGTAPAPLVAPDALYYAGWYSFNAYADVFTWQPGAIGGHLDSCSACDLRGGPSWSANALRRGITATFGAVNEPYVAGMPEYDQLFTYLTQGANFGEAAYQATVVGAWMMVFVGDPLYRPYAQGSR